MKVCEKCGKLFNCNEGKVSLSYNCMGKDYNNKDRRCFCKECANGVGECWVGIKKESIMEKGELTVVELKSEI